MSRTRTDLSQPTCDKVLQLEWRFQMNWRHPRMATEQRGPEPTRQLEPPGFLAMNYGRRTPVSVIIAHLVYGAVLGAFYRLR